MKVLVTGGAGYIGSILVPELLRKGYEVTVIDNFMYNQTSLLDCCYNKKLKIVRGDVRNETFILKYIRDADVILPLACIVSMPACEKKPTEATSTNLDAIKMMLQVVNDNQKIIFPTTNSGYGIGKSGVFCTEETPLKPISLYGRLKVEAEKCILTKANSITLRLATVFGISPRMRLDLLVNDFTHRAVTDKFLVLFESHFKRNYIHIRDVAKAFIHCIDNFDEMRGESYNIGLSDVNISKLELCKEIKKQIPDFYFIEAEIGEDPDKRDYIVSNEKIESTGFKPEYSLQQGITELIKGFQIIKNNQFTNV